MQDALLPSGHERRKKGRTESVLYRCTPERKEQLVRLSQRLSIGRPKDDPVTYTETLNQALDALEARLRLEKKQ